MCWLWDFGDELGVCFCLIGCVLLLMWWVGLLFVVFYVLFYVVVKVFELLLVFGVM